MAGKSGVEFVEEWQTGAFLIVFSVGVGAALAFGLGSALASTPAVMVGGFIGGVLAAFLLSSYIIYGR